MIKIEKGWCFCSADFSLQASGNSKTGRVSFIRDVENREKWHKLMRFDEELIESNACPELYVSGTGISLEEAFVNANLPFPDNATDDTLL